MPGNIFNYSYYFTRIVAEGGPSTSREVDIQSYYIKEPKMDISPHREMVLPIKGPVIHDASEFMTSHLVLNYVEVSHHFQSVTGVLLTGKLFTIPHCMYSITHACNTI